MQPKPIALIVEDEFLVRLFAIEIAEEAGFSVLEATDAHAAISFLQNRNDVRVVLADIDLPGDLDGLELAVAIRHRWPSIQVVVTSGRMRPDNDELPERSHFIPKPYDIYRLTGLLRELGG